MHWKITPIAAATVGLTWVMPGAAMADFLNDLGTGVGIVRDACAIVGCNTQPQRERVIIRDAPREPRAPRPVVSEAEQRRRAAERQANIDVQTALNGFGFNVGTADGSLGPRSRAAIGAYQSYMGYPSSGFLDDNQRAILLNSYARLQAGEGARYPQIAASEGPAGLLKAFNDPNYIGRYGVAPNAQPPYPGGPVAGLPGNGTPGPNPGTVPPGAGGLAGGGTPTQAAQPYDPPGRANDGFGGVTDAAPLGPLEALQPVDQVASSMADRCQFVELTTQTNQGPIRVSNMTDPAQALSEQFCEARGYAISVSQTTAAKVRASEAQLVTSCQQISAAMAPVRAALASTPPEAIAAQAKAVNQRIAPDASAAATYGQICLGLGYRQDDAEMALSANLLMVGAGYMPFGEMLGHHLREGFGAGPSNGAALPWYEAALTALQGNAQPVFLPSKSAERVGVIRAAIDSGQIRASGPAMAGTLVPISAPLPGGHAIAP